MADVELTDDFLTRIAGWEVMKRARGLLAGGRVLSSSWVPPVLKGVVQADDTSYRAGLVIRDTINIDNLCTCRESRQWGTMCVHSIAVGLHVLKPAAPVAAGAGIPGVGGGRPEPARAGEARGKARDPVRLKREGAGTPIEVGIVLPPNLAEAVQRGRVMLVVEGVGGGQRLPLQGWCARGAVRLDAMDGRLLDVLEPLAGGDTPSMVQLPVRDLVELLPVLVDHPRVTCGRDRRLRISKEACWPALKVSLKSSGELELAARAPAGAMVPLVGEGGLWFLAGDELRPCGVPAAWRGVLQGPVKIPRDQVPVFLGRDWAALAAGGMASDFDPSTIVLDVAAPAVELDLAGGLAELTGILRFCYGGRRWMAGEAEAAGSGWSPDPENPRRYVARDAAAEREAGMRLRRAGFAGPDASGRWLLRGQDRVLGYFAREHPRLEREWTVTLEARLERSTRNSIERMTPRLRVLPAGEQWFDFEVGYESSEGTRLSAADVQALLHGSGAKRLSNGKWAVIDTGAVEELQQVLVDCAPEQRLTGGGATYRIRGNQAGYVASSIREAGLAVDAPAAWRERWARQTGEARWVCPPLGALEAVLRPYQKEGVAWLGFLRESGFGGLLADEMGLGKTLQMLAHVVAVREGAAAGGGPVLPSLVVCPTSLVYNWVAEAERFAPGLRVLAVQGPDRRELFGRMGDAALVVTSYALLRRDLEAYGSMAFDTLILDEAQHIKNRDTQNAQAVKALRAANRMVLTGTPLENSVLDLWSLFDFLMPGYLGTAQDFRERYEIPIVRERDAGTMGRLARRVRPFVMRRLKKDVVKELPPRVEQVLYCELTPEQSAVYQQLLSATRKEVLETSGQAESGRGRMLVLTALLRLRQACCDLRLFKMEEQGDGDDDTASGGGEAGGKVQAFGELLDEVIDGGHRVLVFSQFTSMLRLLRADLETRGIGYCELDGSTRDRGAVVDRFQKDTSVPVFLISLKAGGVGLNLTGADTVIHFDPWWNPAVEDQATDRAHRIGQTRVVTSYKLIARGTVEEKILTLQRRKRELLASALSGEEAVAQALTWEEIRELLD